MVVEGAYTENTWIKVGNMAVKATNNTQMPYVKQVIMVVDGCLTQKTHALSE